MKGKMLVLVLLIFAFLTAGMTTAQEKTEISIPTITAEYNEQVEVREAYIESSSTGDTFPVSYRDGFHEVFNFTPLDRLQNDNYALLVNASDRLNNTRTDEFDFEVDVPFTIWLLEPDLGVSPTSPYDVVVETSAEARCSYSNSDTDLEGGTMIDAEGEYKLTHTVEGVDWEDEKWFNCRTEEGINGSQEFQFGIDTTPPNINVDADPNPVIDPGRRQTELTVSTSDEAACWLDGEFMGENPSVQSAYKKERSKTLNYDISDTDRHEFNYTISCQNKAGLVNSVNHTVVVNLKEDFTITQKRPDGATNDDPVQVAVETPISADCTFSENETFMESTDELTHTTSVDGLGEGDYSYIVECEATRGEPVNTTVSFTVDRTSPTNASISAPDKVCDLSSIEATFSAQDAMSSVSFNYTIKEGSEVLIGPATTSNTQVSRNVDLTPGTEYTWEMTAVDEAGNTQSAGSATVTAKNSTDPVCDEFRPYVEVNGTDGSGGKNYEVTCRDDNSGCQEEYNYSTSEMDEECEFKNHTRQSLDSDLFVPYGSRLCIWVSDNNGNTAFKEFAVQESTGDGDEGSDDDDGDDDGDDEQEENETITPEAPDDDGADGGELCGNGQIDPGEQCDGGNLDGKRFCDDIGLTGGRLSCSNCQWDKSNCRSTSEEFSPEGGEGASTIGLIMLILGLLMMFGGGGYLGYKKYYGPGVGGGQEPSPEKKPKTPPKQPPRQPRKKEPDVDEVREKEREKLIEKSRRAKKKKEREELFDEFDTKSEKDADTDKIQDDFDEAFGSDEDEE